LISFGVSKRNVKMPLSCQKDFSVYQILLWSCIGFSDTIVMFYNNTCFRMTEVYAVDPTVNKLVEFG